MFTFGSLFAGIGGFDLGLEWAGMNCEWQVEIDPFCQRVLSKHWPDVVRYKDVRECGKHNLQSVDLVCGGFPCQPHSIAGKQRGAADDRNLWPEYRRIVKELRPRWILAENVLGIRTTMLDQVLSDLEGLAYTIGTLVIPACAFDAPHRRERVFIIAYAESDLRRTSRNDRPVTSNRGSPFVAHTSCQFRDGGDDDGRCRSRQIPKLGDCAEETRPFSGGRAVESDLGLLVDGLPTGLVGCRWLPEPPVGRIATGIPDRVAKLRTLGNAVVPQVAEWLGRQILAVEEMLQDETDDG